MKNLRTLMLMLLVAGAALAVPAIASADTYCVNAGVDCPVGGLEFVNLQNAIDTAAATEVADELLLGDKDTPYFGPFVYQPPPSRAANRLTIKGVGGRPSADRSGRRHGPQRFGDRARGRRRPGPSSERARRWTSKTPRFRG